MAERATQVRIAVDVDKNSVRVSSTAMRQFFNEQNRQQRLTHRQMLALEVATTKAQVKEDEARKRSSQSLSAQRARLAAGTSKDEIRAQTVITRETLKQNALRQRAAEQETRTREAQIAKQKRDVDGRARYEYQTGQKSLKDYIAHLHAEEQAETQSYARRNRLLNQRLKLEASQPKPTSMRPTLSGVAGAGVFVGGVAGVAVTAATIAAKRAIELAADSENALNQLKFVTGATEAQMVEAGAAARQLGGDINLPKTSSVDAAKAMLEMSKAGFDLQNSMDSARGSLALAAAAETDAGTAAGITASLLKAFGLEGKEAGRVADLLAASANNSLGEIQDVALAAQQASAIFKMARFSVEDLTTDIALMANAGIKGSDAGTSLKTAIIALTSPTDSQMAAQKRLNLQLYDGSGKLKSHDEIIRLVSKSVKGLTEEQRNQALKTLFGNDALRAANIVFAAGVEKVEAMRSKVTEFGAATETAAAKNKGLKGSIDAFNSTLDTFQEKYGSKFLDPLTKSFGVLGDLIDILDDYIDKQKEAGNLNLASEYARNVGDTIKYNAQSVRTMKGERGKAAQASTDAFEFRQALLNGTPLGDDDTNLRVAAKRYGVELDRPQFATHFPKEQLEPLIKAAEAVSKNFLEAQRIAGLQASAAKSEKGEMMRLQGRTSRETNGAYTPTRHITTEAEEKAAEKARKEREKASRKAARERASSDRKAQHEIEREAKKDDKDVESWFKAMYRAVEITNRFQKNQAERANKMNAEADALLGKAAKEATEKTYNVALNSLDNGLTDPAQIENIQKQLRYISKQWLHEEIKRLRAIFETSSTRQSDDNDETYAARQRRAQAAYDTGKNAAEGAYNQRTEKTDDAVKSANKNLATATEKAADAERDRARESMQSLGRFLDAESTMIDLRIEQAEKDRNYEKWVAGIRDRLQNAIEQNGPKLFSFLVGGDPSESAEAAAAIAVAQARSKGDLKSVSDQQRADEKSRGRDRFFIDEDGLTRDRHHSSLNKKGVREYQKVDGAAIDALASMTDSAKERGGDFFKAMMNGESGKNALRDLGRNIGRDLGETTATFLQRKLIDGPLEKLFDSYADKFENALSSGGKEAGGNIAGAAALLANAANFLGKNGKKKQRNSILGAAIGFGVGSILPGVGNLAAAGFGAQLGGMFADGGIPPINKDVLVGEEGPELVRFGGRARIYPADETARIVSGGGMGGSVVNHNYYAPLMSSYTDTVNDRADSDRQTQELLSGLDAVLNRG